jgi:hypothetical protein
MGEGNGTNGKTRDRLFHEFHRQVSEGHKEWDWTTRAWAPKLRPFAPYFMDELVGTMRYAPCLSERTYAWVLWRAQGNSARWAMSDWDPAIARFLDQTDCALDLAWFEEGRPVEWVEGMPPDYRERARKDGAPERPKGVKPRPRISEAFARNEAYGRVIHDGRKIGAVISPAGPSGELPQKFGARVTFEEDETFLEWWKVTEPANFAAWVAARTAYFETRKPGRSAYSRYKNRGTSGAPHIIDVKTLGNDLPNPPTASQPLVVDTPESPAPEELAGWPEGGDDTQSTSPDLRAEVQQHLESFPIPDPLTPEVVEQVASAITTEGLLEQFREATKPNRIKPRKWVALVHIALKVARDGARYARAKELAKEGAGSGGIPDEPVKTYKIAEENRRRQEEIRQYKERMKAGRKGHAR